VGGYLAVAILLYVIFGNDGRNEEFQPQDEFKLDPWIELKIGSLDLSSNKAVLYLLITCVLTVGTMLLIARRMQQRPNRTQTIMEGAYDLTYSNIAKGNMSEEAAAKWFPFVASLFFFIWFSNMVGYIPLPVNDHETIDIFGIDFPAFALYAATANLSIPLVLTLTVFFLYQAEGIRRHGFVRYLKGWLPAGVSGGAAVPIFVIEVISQFVRIISLSVRLFANILAGHLLILFMGGGLAVLLGIAALGWITLPIAIAFFIFEVGLIATLQAFIFATLTSIYFGEASAGGH
jgi:F-type H+-transporting ATPase subunit a